MGDVNQLNWISRHAGMIKGPVLEVGSRHYDSHVSIDYRGLCPGLEYVGTDLSAGPNVDVVADFSAPYETLVGVFGERRFRTVIGCSVLEHCAAVTRVAENISQFTAPGGVLFVSLPFAWRFHGYPNDYFRATPEGVKQLFPGFDFPSDLATLSSNRDGDVRLMSDDPEHVNQFMTRWLTRPEAPSVPDESLISRAVRALTRGAGVVDAIRRRSDQRRGLGGYKYVLVPTNVNMVGIKRPSPTGR